MLAGRVKSERFRAFGVKAVSSKSNSNLTTHSSREKSIYKQVPKNILARAFLSQI